MSLQTMREAFRTTVSGGGEYTMVFRFPSIEAMHQADNEWHTWRRETEPCVAEHVQRDDDHHSSTKASIALLCTGIAGLIVAAGLLAMVVR